jgi:hypothetical protein
MRATTYPLRPIRSGLSAGAQAPQPGCGVFPALEHLDECGTDHDAFHVAPQALDLLG